MKTLLRVGSIFRDKTHVRAGGGSQRYIQVIPKFKDFKGNFELMARCPGKV